MSSHEAGLDTPTGVLVRCQDNRSVSAVFRSGGHVGVTWTLRPWPRAAGGWDGSVVTWLEAGEQMSTLSCNCQMAASRTTPEPRSGRPSRASTRWRER
ncbi:DUF6228 family protein [Kitasatospora sp. NPDC096128]|uniref:DUF6228 family protein n=1 Tax=Kitasatospora sp. NPDC096128 TaxID=3155547 RepID=UPI00332FFA70